MAKLNGTKRQPFDWMEPRRNPEHVKTEKARREAMYRTELEERAALLHRLGHSRDAARARLAANLDWDFPGGSGPVAAGALDGIIDRVYGSAGTSKPARSSSGKGGTR
jgi:hypothetical protein